MAHRVEDSFPDRSLVKSRDVQNKEPLLKVLKIVSKIDGIPEIVQDWQKTLAELASIGCRTRRLAGPVLENDLRLGKVFA